MWNQLVKRTCSSVFVIQKSVNLRLSHSSVIAGAGNVIRHPKICIVGSGPAGFYTAQHLIKVSVISHINI